MATINKDLTLQQYLPFTVLKLDNFFESIFIKVATVLTVYGIETRTVPVTLEDHRCNSTYRLRY